MKLIHYSDEIIESLDDRKYDQNGRRWKSKPFGFWISVEDENVGENWKEWCESENFQVENLKYSHQITLKEDSNILYISTPEDLFSFTKKYPSKIGFIGDTNQLDWDEVSKIYQGIIISPYQCDCRMSLESCWYYGWDCSSGCIWDLKCIEQFNKI
jgi:hypothetical protein